MSQSTSPTGPAQPEPLGPGLRAPGLDVGEHLGGKRLVDLDQAEVRPLDAGPLEGEGHREGRAHQELPPGIDRRHGVAPNRGERAIAQRPGLLLGHQQHRRRAVGERRGVAGGHRAVAAVEDRLELGERLERGVGPDAVVAGEHLVHAAAAEPGSDLGGEPPIGRGRRGPLVAHAARCRSCASRRMPFSLAIFSADCPIDSPVEGSAIAGVTGTRSRGRSRDRMPRRCPTLRALLRLDQELAEALASAGSECRRAIPPRPRSPRRRGPA